MEIKYNCFCLPFGKLIIITQHEEEKQRFRLLFIKRSKKKIVNFLTKMTICRLASQQPFAQLNLRDLFIYSFTLSSCMIKIKKNTIMDTCYDVLSDFCPMINHI